MIVHNLTLNTPISDSALLIAVGLFSLIMIILCVIGLIAERRRLHNLEAAEAAEEQREHALAAPYTPTFTAAEIAAAASTNSRRAIARDSQKGSTHE